MAIRCLSLSEKVILNRQTLNALIQIIDYPLASDKIKVKKEMFN